MSAIVGIGVGASVGVALGTGVGVGTTRRVTVGTGVRVKAGVASVVGVKDFARVAVGPGVGTKVGIAAVATVCVGVEGTGDPVASAPHANAVAEKPTNNNITIALPETNSENRSTDTFSLRLMIAPI